ncbi:MAG: DNA-directed RNA polymerase subunit omega [bacterium]
MEIHPIELEKVEKYASNVYEAVIVAAKRAKMINENNKLEFNTILSTMTGSDDDEFEEKGNPDQLKLSLDFEKRPKAHITALKELLEGKIEYRFKEV